MQLKKRGLLPTDRTYSSMFAACGAAGPSAAATLDKIREEMERRDVQPNTITLNSLISALALCGQHQDAAQAFVDMEKMYIEPDLCTFGSLLMTLSKDKSRGMSMAQGVWSEMKAKLEPDLHCYNMLLQVLRDGGLEGTVDGEVQSQSSKTRLIPLVSSDVLKTLVEGVTKSNEKERQRRVSEREATVTTERDGERAVLKEEEAVEEREEIATKKSEDVWEGSVARELSENNRDGSVAREASEDNREGSVAREASEVKKASVAREASKDNREGNVAREASELGEKEHRQKNVLKKEGRREVLNWCRGEGTWRSKVYVRGEVKFELSEQHYLMLSVGCERAKDGQPTRIRWLEKSSIEALFAAMKQKRLRPDIHTFHLLAHLTLDPAHLLVTMRERRVTPDVKLMVAAVTQQAKQLHNLQGAWVRY